MITKKKSRGKRPVGTALLYPGFMTNGSREQFALADTRINGLLRSIRNIPSLLKDYDEQINKLETNEFIQKVLAKVDWQFSAALVPWWGGVGIYGGSMLDLYTYGARAEDRSV